MKSSGKKERQYNKLNEFNRELDFSDNSLAQELFGSHHCNLARIEQLLKVIIHPRGNLLKLMGEEQAVNKANDVLALLYKRLEHGLKVNKEDIDAAVRMPNKREANDESFSAMIKTANKLVLPRSAMQVAYLRSVDEHKLVFAEGPAGTGKTYLAVAKAVEYLVRGEVDRIILSRPAVEAGEQLGFLPGDMRDKVDPYLRPLYDALNDMLPLHQVTKRLETGEIEVAPLAFMRGRTLSNAFVILDEAQNTSPIQMKMFLTRLGENSRMVITGDLSQVDLPRGVWSGLRDAMRTLHDVKGLAFVRFDSTDVIRHSLVAKIVEAYGKVECCHSSSSNYNQFHHNNTSEKEQTNDFWEKGDETI